MFLVVVLLTYRFKEGLISPRKTVVTSEGIMSFGDLVLFLFKSYDYMSSPIPTTEKIEGKKEKRKRGSQVSRKR